MSVAQAVTIAALVALLIVLLAARHYGRRAAREIDRAAAQKNVTYTHEPTSRKMRRWEEQKKRVTFK